MCEYIKIYQGYTWTGCIKQAVEAIYKINRDIKDVCVLNDYIIRD